MLDLQGVVTLIMPVKPFTTRPESKCNQRINTSFVLNQAIKERFKEAIKRLTEG